MVGVVIRFVRWSSRRLERNPTLVELAGLALIVAGVAAWSKPAAIVAAGVALVGEAYVLERKRRPRPPSSDGEARERARAA